MSEENELSVKVVLLGESGVGKTCIIGRFIDNTFDKNIKSTTGADYTGKTMTFPEYGGKQIKFEIWDTAGQEIYRALTKIFYKDAKIAILVYDITKRETYEEMKEYWYYQVREAADQDVIIAIAANKCDMYEEEKVTEGEGREFAKKIGAFYQLTSAFTNIGIEDLFKTIGKQYLDFYISNKNKNKAEKKIILPETNLQEKKIKKGCC